MSIFEKLGVSTHLEIDKDNGDSLSSGKTKKPPRQEPGTGPDDGDKLG